MSSGNVFDIRWHVVIWLTAAAAWSFHSIGWFAGWWPYNHPSQWLATAALVVATVSGVIEYINSTRTEPEYQ